MNNKNENESGLSPTPTKRDVVEGEVLLNFFQALELVLLYKKIHKLEWKDKGFYGVLSNDILKIHKPDGKLYDWTLCKEDIIGTDYVLVD